MEISGLTTLSVYKYTVHSECSIFIFLTSFIVTITIVNDVCYLLCFADAFSLVTDGSGRMTRIRLDMFVQELLILPAAVFESPSFEYTEGIARTLFDQVCSLFFVAFCSCIRICCTR